MNDFVVSAIIADLLVVLAAGFVSGVACKRLGISLLLGYLVVGVLIGEGGLRAVSQENHELEYLAQVGALLLLFSVGIEFSLEELARMGRFLLIGGAVQMAVVILVTSAACVALGMEWNVALLIGFSTALSSTVLVFRALAEWGQSASPHGRRAIGILLFQDVALIPLMLFVPLLTGGGEAPSIESFGWLALKSLVFVVALVLLRLLIAKWMVALLANLRSVELMILFGLFTLGGACWVAFLLGLPPAVGALAAGLMLSGNRLSRQMDTLVLPYRESFAAVFFVTLGTLLHPMQFLHEPFLLAGGLFALLLLKAIAAGLALRLTGLGWPASLGMGFGLAQLGEFSFLLLGLGRQEGILTGANYNRMLFLAMGTLIVTPPLLQFGLRWTAGETSEPEDERERWVGRGKAIQKAVVIGIGPIGRQIVSRLEIMGVDVCLIDLSPVNLHAFAQQGFQTVAGDARDPDVLRRADVNQCRLAVVSVPDDAIAGQVVRSLRDLNPDASIIVRCRYVQTVASVTRAGADGVVSEEAEASGALMHMCETIVRSARAQASHDVTES